jgi:hypothetical protein
MTADNPVIEVPFVGGPIAVDLCSSAVWSHRFEITFVLHAAF